MQIITLLFIGMVLATYGGGYISQQMAGLTIGGIMVTYALSLFLDEMLPPRP